MVFTYAFPLFLLHVGGTHFYLTGGRALSVLGFILLGPLWARHVDRQGGKAPRKHFFIAATLTGLFTATLGIPSLLWTVVSFILAGFFYQITLALYNNLLPEAGGDETGIASGLGVALGYVGSALALTTTRLVSPPYPVLFLSTAFLFAFFASLTTLHTPPRSHATQPPASLFDVFRVVIKDRTFGIFLLVAFTLTEPAHTGILLLSIYFKKVFALSDGTIALLLAGGAVSAAIGALVWGWAAQTWSARKVFGWLFPLWTLGLLSIAFTPPWGVPVLAVLLGALLAGIWVLLRLVLLETFSDRPLTLYFTYLALIERAASMIGPLLWSGVVQTLHNTPEAYRIATGGLALFPLLGWVFYRSWRKGAT